ncbi:hypothetical protein NDU88_002421 [Pleurodeles waltl]|uniref:Uncharacterized protein n=1 Tax=Pleurodeles waltl TaxID=8319 RepID=A0AAV7T372_PLEWA|nr:hypothetical protein NDU88_002421 [Pleurodeles waltl]
MWRSARNRSASTTQPRPPIECVRALLGVLKLPFLSSMLFSQRHLTETVVRRHFPVSAYGFVELRLSCPPSGVLAEPVSVSGCSCSSARLGLTGSHP